MYYLCISKQKKINNSTKVDLLRLFHLTEENKNKKKFYFIELTKKNLKITNLSTTKKQLQTN